MEIPGDPASDFRKIVFGPATLTTGCRPIVFVTTPPQPASNARMMFDSDSVWGAAGNRNGLRSRSPVNVVDGSGIFLFSRGPSSTCRAGPHPRRGRPLSPHGRLDQTVRLIGGDEHLVRVVEPERREIDEQMMAIRQRQRHLVYFVARIEDGRGHRMQRVLNRATVVRRERVEQPTADEGPRTELSCTPMILPAGRHGGRENAVLCFGKRRVSVSGKAGKG